MEKTYKYRLYPNKEQSALIEQTFGCCRFVHNRTLAMRQEHFNTLGITLKKYDCVKLLPSLKAENPWLKDVDAIALQTSVEDMDTAYQNFFRGLKSGKPVGFPKFKSKRHSRAAYHTKKVATISRWATGPSSFLNLGGSSARCPDLLRVGYFVSQ